MRFQITGQEEPSLISRIVEIDAKDEDEAKAYAAMEGLTILRLERLPDLPPSTEQNPLNRGAFDTKIESDDSSDALQAYTALAKTESYRAKRKSFEIGRGWLSLFLALVLLAWGGYSAFTPKFESTLISDSFYCGAPILLAFVALSFFGAIHKRENPRIGAAGCGIAAIIGAIWFIVILKSFGILR